MTLDHVADDGCRLAVEVSGPAHAPCLVLVHSLGTSRALWDGLAAALGDAVRVVRFDLRGHGTSAVPEGDYTMARLGQDVLSVMDGLGVTRAHVAGCSIGGQVVLWLGIHAPGRVNRLVVLNSGARLQDEAFWTGRMAAVRADGLGAIADGVIARWFSAAFQQRAPAVVTQYRDRLAATPVTGYVGCCAALRDSDLREPCSRITAPTLVVAGQHDTSTPPALAHWLGAHVPGALVEEVDAAHLSPVERPGELAARLRVFLGA